MAGVAESELSVISYTKKNLNHWLGMNGLSVITQKQPQQHAAQGHHLSVSDAHAGTHHV
jgi:hypothetical protein